MNRSKFRILAILLLVLGVLLCLVSCEDSDGGEGEGTTAHTHVYDEGVVTKEPTIYEEGVLLRTCTGCGETIEKSLSMLPPTYVITMDGIGECKVGEDGAYQLPQPEKVGYRFVRWTLAGGETFAATGTVSASVTVYPEFAILSTTTAEQLATLAVAGADKILIDADILLDRPIYVISETILYAEQNVKITRAPGYLGDLFVVGIDAEGTPSVLKQQDAILTLDGTRGKITIDGNRANMTEKVVGSAIFLTDSGVVNMFDGVTIANHFKDGNERAYICTRWTGEWMAERAGGAAVLILNGSFNMYGGVIENNRVRCETTPIAGSDSWSEEAGCGGAIYNCGSFNLYGGIIRGNEGLYGGAIYNDEIVRLVAGTISGNRSYSKGGAVASSADAESEMYIGTDKVTDQKMVFSGNTADAGGALYSNTDSPIVIASNTIFENNQSLYGGGAIYTAGGLTISGAVFEGNSTPNAGGAIYFHYNHKEGSQLVRRQMSLTDCTFLENTASLGGAVALSATDAAKEKGQGAYATVTNCVFDGNTADNCGAFYITRCSEAVLTDSVFTDNSSTGLGGAISVQADCKLTCTNVRFENNSAANAGALYLYNCNTVSLRGVAFVSNKATSGNGGAIYYNAIRLTLDNSLSFQNNSATNHGGAIYASYITNADQTVDGAELVINGASFTGNTALAGGAISARTASSVTIKNATFTSNATPKAASGSDAGGGAIYADFATIAVENTTFDGCSSGYYGGAMRLHACATTLTTVTIQNGVGGTGAAIHAYKGTLTATDLRVKNTTSGMSGVLYFASLPVNLTGAQTTGNTSVYGTICVSGADATLTISGGAVSSNSATYGGAIYTEGSTISISGTTFVGNSATNGGAIYTTGLGLTISVATFEDNAAEYGGAIYASGAQNVTVENTKFESNIATADGGAIYVARVQLQISGANTLFSGNSAARGGAIYLTNQTVASDKLGAVLTMTGGSFADNKATVDGGAISIRSVCTATFVSTTFTENTANGTADTYGGAIYVGWGTLTLQAVTASGNGATFGGALYADSATLSVNNGSFEANIAQCGGAISLAGTAGASTITGGFYESNVATYGGAIHIISGTLSIEQATFEENIADCGGAIYAVGDVAMTMSNSNTLTGNIATADGGAIYLAKGKLTATGTLFNNNEAGRGGAIYLTNQSVGGQTVGAELVLTSGMFTANRAKEGGAISIRSACKASIDDTTFNFNVANGSDASQGGGAIYVGWATLFLADTTIQSNLSTAAGGGVYANNAMLQVQGNTVITGNTAGAITPRVDCNVLLTAGKQITVVGALENAQIGVTADEGVFAAGDGVNVLDITTYAAMFTSDAGKPVYVEDGALCMGLLTTIQPSTFNDFTVDSNAAETYRWYLATDLAREQVVCEGKTLTGVAEGLEYVCVMSYGVHTIESNVVTYYAKQTHPACGAVCSHTTHEDLGYRPIATAEELTKALTLGGNYYLVRDIEISTTLYTATDVALCLNGKILSAAEGVADFTMIRASGALTITDCTATERVGYIHPETGAWVAGAYTGTQTAEPVTLKGGILMGAHGVWGGAINATAALELYNINFVGNRATSDGGAIYVNGAYPVGLHNVTFVANSATGNGGAIGLSAGTMTADGDNRFLYNHAGAHAGALYVVSGATVQMTSGSFVGNTAVDGGAVSVRSNCTATFDGTVFTNNSASGTADTQGGGAIYVGWGTLNLHGATFTGNSSAGYGGAVNANNATLSVENGVFDANSAVDGGAIGLSGDKGTTTITGASFDENTATSGGAIHITGGAPTITGATFAENTAASGGAIYAIGDVTVTIANTAFDQNASTADGGAIYAARAKVNVSGDTLFTGNRAGRGGAIYLTNQSVSGQNVGAVLTMTGGSFVGNTATTDGGAVSVRSACTATFNSTTFTENSASGTTDAQGGGAIYVGWGTLNLNGATFTGNTSAGFGSAINANNATFTMQGKVVMANNTIYLTKSKQIAITGAIEAGSRVLVQATDRAFAAGEGVDAYASYFTVDAGQKVYAQDDVLYAGHVHPICGEVCTHNGAHADVVFKPITSATELSSSLKAGGNYYLTTDITISGEIQTSKQFALCLHGKTLSAASDVSDFTMLKISAVSAFTDCTEVQREGYVHPETGAWTAGAYTGTESVKTITLKGGVIMGAHGAWGGVINTTAAIDVYNVNFVNNKVTSDGGAIYVNGAYPIGVYNATFACNYAKGNGGAIGLSGAKLTADGANRFLYNSVGGHAGALYVVSSATVQMTGGSFIGNTAVDGGAVSVRSNCTATFDGTVFTSNSASGTTDTTGGGAFYVGWGTLNLSDATLTGNTSAGYGGAVSANNAVVTVDGGSFTGNTAVNGGAIALTGTSKATTIPVKNASFTGNSAAIGGAISVNGTQIVLVENTTFAENTASGGAKNAGRYASGGGAIYISSSSIVEVDGGIFRANSSTGADYYDTAIDAGGAVLVDGGVFRANGTQFTGNTSATAGGAIGSSHLKTTTMQITNCTFTQNAAKGASSGNGGAIFIQNAEHNEKIVISDCTFIGNAAVAAGSSIYVRTNSSATILNIVSRDGSNASWASAIYATTNSHVIFSGTVDLAGSTGGKADTILAKASVTVRYTTEEEKNAWTAVIAGGGTITYVDVSTGE